MECNLCGSRRIGIYVKFGNYRLLKCKRCGLLTTDQTTIKDDLYSSDYFGEVHTNFFADCKVGYEKQIRKSEKLRNFLRVLRKLKRVKPEGKMLDVGCATGVFLDMAQKEGYDVTGVDVSEYACKYAKENFGIKTKQGFLEEVKLKEKSFDIITLWDVLEHVQDPNKFLNEAKRLLKDDGLIFILTVNDSSLMGWIAEGVYLGSLKTLPIFTRMIHPIHHNYHFKEKHLRAYLRKTGLKVMWKEKSEMPVENAEGGFVVKSMLRIFYPFSKLLNLEHEIRLIVKKV